MNKKKYLRIKNSLPVNSKLEEITTYFSFDSVVPATLLRGGKESNFGERKKQKKQNMNSLTWTRSYITPIEC